LSACRVDTNRFVVTINAIPRPELAQLELEPTLLGLECAMTWTSRQTIHVYRRVA